MNAPPVVADPAAPKTFDRCRLPDQRQPAGLWVGEVASLPTGICLRLGRLAIRLPTLAAVLLGALGDYARERWSRRGDPAEWQRRWSCRLLRALRVKVAVRGAPPAQGLLVSNHLGYLDVLVLASRQPLVFVAKAQVERWPVFGRLARLAGARFIDRERWGEVRRLGAEFERLVNHGHVVAWFPEGTTSGGERVLPFHSALLEPAVAHLWPVTPAWIGYALEDGDPAKEVCYWGDMTFLPHLLNLLTRREVRACVIYGQAPPAARDRKALARELHARVGELRWAGQRALA